MKKLLLIISALILVSAAMAQDSLNYRIYDRFGNVYALSDLVTKTTGGGGPPAFTTNGNTCQAGYFEIFFEDVGTGMGFYDAADGLKRRNVVCQVFEDLSKLIVPTNNPATGQPATVRIRIATDNTQTSLANASAYYFDHLGSLSDGEVWKTINTGIDDWDVNGPLLKNYVGVVPTFYAGRYYHGFIAVNFNLPPGTVYNYSFTSPPQSNEYDFYSIILHEAIHTLGFGSFINSAGKSVVAFNSHAFTRYDSHLHNAAGVKFIDDNADCLLQNTISIPNPADVTSGCTNVLFGAQQEPVYAPNPYISGSSLSHFDDVCSNLPYVMRWSRKTGDMQRRPLQQEVDALCALNYKLTNTYGAIPGNVFSYYNAYTACDKKVAANNDFYFPGSTNPYQMKTGQTLTISNILNNDINVASIACAELVKPQGNIAITAMTGNSITVHLNFAEQPYYIIAYRARGTNGELSNVAYIYIYALPNDIACGNPACNLVPNNSFEDKYVCPTTGDNVYSNGWFSIRTGCDYFNTCSTVSSGYNVPNTLFGAQSARTGNAYIGAGDREKATIKLCQPLVRGRTYIVQMYASRADNFSDPFSIGFALTTNWIYYDPMGRSNLKPFMRQDISDATNWTLVQASYVAAGGEQYLTVGGFQTNLSLSSYCFIDDISVTDVLPLTVNAGPDRIATGSVVIGGAPTATGGKTPLTYQWSPTTAMTGSTTANPTVNPPATTTYSVTVTDVCGASMSDAMVLYRCGVNAGMDVTICQGSQTQLQVAQGARSYQWAPATGLSSTTVYNPTARPNVTTTYRVTVTDAANCTASDDVVVNVTPSYSVNIQASPSATICEGSDVLLTAIASNGSNTYSYNWDATVSLPPSVNRHNQTLLTPPLSSNATFTVTVTSGGCSVISNKVIVVNPNPTVTIAVNPPSFCVSSTTTATLTATPISGATYVWSSGTTGSGNSVRAKPTTAGVYNYTVTVTNSSHCSNTATATLTVLTAPPPISVTASPTVICLGDISTLTANPPVTGGTYIWSSGATGTVNTVVVKPTAAGFVTYRVTVNDGGCSATAQQQILVNPTPTVNISSTTSYVCPAIPTVTLTAHSNGNTFAWSGTDGSTYTGNPITVSPTAATSYTVTATNSSNCSNTALVAIDYLSICPCNPCADVLPTTLNTGTYTGNHCINRNTDINGTVNFVRGEFKIAGTVVITVKPGAVLNIRGSHLYACGDMWQGIVVQNGGRLNITSEDVIQLFGGVVKTYSSFIEDAITAVSIQNYTASTSAGVNILSVDNTIFNRNYIGIFISNYAFTNRNIYPFSVQNCLFTNRGNYFHEGAYDWPEVRIAKMATSASPGLNQPYIDNNRFPVVDGLKNNPSGLQHAHTGVLLSSVGVTTAPTTTPSYYEVQIGAASPDVPNNYNLFDNLTVGVFALNSNLTSINNVFQNTYAQGNLFPGNSYSDGAGNGIYAQSVGPFNPASVSPPGPLCRVRAIAGDATTNNYINKFYNCATGVQSIAFYENTFTNCDIRSHQTISTASSFGHQGIYILSNQYRNVNIANNTIYNVADAVDFKAYTGPFSTDLITALGSNSGQYSGQVNITGNTIQPQAPTIGLGTGLIGAYVSTAITADNIGAPTNVIPGTTINISNNTNINGVYRGITCSNWNRRNKQIINSGNTISFLQDNIINLFQYGIYHSGNQGIPSTPNVISFNNVTGFSPNTRDGIRFGSCSNQNVSCNTASTASSGFEFDGDNTVGGTTTWANNNMRNNAYGYILQYNGKIGPQGNSSTPSGNNWYNSTSYKTAALNGSDVTKSVLYVDRASGVTNPDGSGYADPSSNSTPYAASNGSLIPRFYGFQPDPCGTIVIGGGPGSGGALRNLSSLEQIALDQVTYGYFPTETKFINKHRLYDALVIDTIITDSSAVLKQFMHQCSGLCIGQLHNIDLALSTGNYTQAQGLVNSIDLLHPTETNYKSYYNAYIKLYTDTVPLPPGDSSTLLTLAQGCPFTDGMVVYNARALYNVAYHTNKVFSDNCPTYSPARKGSFNNNAPSSKAFPQRNLGGEASFDVMLVPNPSTGKVFITPYELTEGTLGIEVMDITGKMIYSDKLQIIGGITNFTLQGDINNGVYFVHITNTATNESTVKKLVIQK